MKYLITSLLVSLISLPACGLLGGSGGDNGPPRTIVFSAQAGDEGTFQIFSMREDGSGIRQLTDGKYGATDPAWSPEGDRIAYARSTGSTAGEELWVMEADGGNKEPLVTNPRTGNPQLGNRPAWSPDGTRLAFDLCLNCEAGGLNHDIYVADLQAGTIDTLTTHPVEDSHPTWSPEGTRIAFTSNRDYFDADSMRWRKDLYVIDMDDNNLNRVTETGKVDIPKWSPDGNKIVYEWNIQGNEVFLYYFSSEQIKNVETGLEFAGGGMWNINGTKLLATGRKNKDDQPEMRLLNIEVEPPEILKRVNLNENAIGRDYDWHDNK